MQGIKSPKRTNSSENNTFTLNLYISALIDLFKMDEITSKFPLKLLKNLKRFTQMVTKSLKVEMDEQHDSERKNMLFLFFTHVCWINNNFLNVYNYIF